MGLFGVRCRGDEGGVHGCLGERWPGPDGSKHEHEHGCSLRVDREKRRQRRLRRRVERRESRAHVIVTRPLLALLRAPATDLKSVFGLGSFTPLSYAEVVSDPGT